MSSLFDFCLGRPLGVALFGAHYLYFSLVAWAVVLVRVAVALSARFVPRLAARKNLRLRPAEGLVLAVFALFLAVEMVQLAVDGSFLNRELWGLPRYFGVFAPFLWLYLAKLLADLWSLDVPKVPRALLRAGLVAALGYVFVAENVMQVSDELLHGNGREAMAAARNIAPAIRSDYKGPRTQKKAVRTLHEYYRPCRPVVFGNFAAAAWAVRGQSEGAEQTISSRGLAGRSRCPYRPDYVFLCLGREGESDFEVDLDETKYEFVKGVRGIKTVWGLFRRK